MLMQIRRLFTALMILFLFSLASNSSGLPAQDIATESSSTYKSAQNTPDNECRPITEETPEINPEKDKLKLPESDTAALLELQKKNDKIALRQKIKESEMLFEKALKSYDKGSVPKARDNFTQSLIILSSANIDASILYELRDNYRQIFAELQKSLSDGATIYIKSGKKYSIPMDTDNELVRKYIKLYSEGTAKPVIKKALERSGRYRPIILRILKEYDLPEELVYLPVVESLYSVNDLSRAGAMGLWQIMPERARALNLKVNYWIDERKDPEKSTRAAAQYLRELYIMFDDWHLALAAYNRGEFGLGRDLQFSKATNIGEMNSRHAVPRETQFYVPQFIASTLIGDNPAEYGFEPIYDKPVEYDKVKIDKIVDLKIAAECAGASLEAIRELNPALKTWCTPHGYQDFELNIPSGTKEAFLANIARVKELNPSSGYIKYKIVKGDCLSNIAKKFGTSITAVKEDNRIKNPNSLRVNQVLIIRPGRKFMSN
jgi:membrane-bound lytic murein transglycosylase D